MWRIMTQMICKSGVRRPHYSALSIEHHIYYIYYICQTRGDGGCKPIGTTLILSWSRHCTLLVEMGQVLLSWPF